MASSLYLDENGMGIHVYSLHITQRHGRLECVQVLRPSHDSKMRKLEKGRIQMKE